MSIITELGHDLNIGGVCTRCGEDGQAIVAYRRQCASGRLPDFSHYTGLPAKPDTTVPAGGAGKEPDWERYTGKKAASSRAPATITTWNFGEKPRGDQTPAKKSDLSDAVFCSGAAALDLLRQPSAEAYETVLAAAVTEAEAMQLCAALEKKIGSELDAIGKSLGVAREGDPDGRFRLLLQQQTLESANIPALGYSIHDPRLLGMIERAKRMFRF